MTQFDFQVAQEDLIWCLNVIINLVLTKASGQFPVADLC